MFICGCRWCMYVHVPACVCVEVVCVPRCMCVWEPEGSLTEGLPCFSPAFFVFLRRSLSLALSSLSQLGRRAGGPAWVLQDHASSSLGSQMCVQCRAFHMGIGYLNSGPYACMVNIFPAEHHLSHTWFGVLFLSFVSEGVWGVLKCCVGNVLFKKMGPGRLKFAKGQGGRFQMDTQGNLVLDACSQPLPLVQLRLQGWGPGGREAEGLLKTTNRCADTWYSLECGGGQRDIRA